MRREFCTLFDANYLVKAVAMHASLRRHHASFRLTCFCFDDEAKRILDALALPDLEAVSLAELEAGDPELVRVKPTRSPVEYCWTSTPAVCLHVLRAHPEADAVTYLDADLLFFADPELLFDEIGDASVCITPHRYAPEYAHHVVSGIYCVQWITFRRDEAGLAALNWWHDRCIEWCFYRLEDDKLGDQKYLDDWPTRFDRVHVLEHRGGGLAPWNITAYEVRDRAGQVFVDDDPLVFFHYHRTQLRHRGTHAWQPPGYPITPSQRELVYDPYLAALDEAIELVRGVQPNFEAGFIAPPSLGVRIRHARATFGAQAASRFPFLLRLRHPLATRSGPPR